MQARITAEAIEVTGTIYSPQKSPVSVAAAVPPKWVVPEAGKEGRSSIYIHVSGAT